MEASVAQGQGQGEAAEGQAAEQTAPGPDLSQLAANLEALQGGQEELRQFLLQQAEQAQDPGDGEPDPVDLSWMDPDDPQFDPSTMADRLRSVIDQAAEQRAQQLMQPLAQRLESLESMTSEERLERDAAALVAEFPELEDQQQAELLAGRGGLAERAAAEIGVPELAAKPAFWRLVYMASRAAETAQQEGAGDDPRVAHLEGGGGARPGSPEVDLGEQIVSGRRGRSVLPFG